MAQLSRKRRRQAESSANTLYLLKHASRNRSLPSREIPTSYLRQPKLAMDNMKVKPSHAPTRTNLRVAQRPCQTPDRAEKAWWADPETLPHLGVKSNKIIKQGKNREAWLRCLRPRLPSGAARLQNRSEK
ncbi:hypothetical protein N7490_006296 [Penicillium lividum]|nr:hypothetical protein N7490_006296 [Penicillium lividum]